MVSFDPDLMTEFRVISNVTTSSGDTMNSGRFLVTFIMYTHRSNSGRLYTVYTFFWPAEFPGYHQWQQESQ